MLSCISRRAISHPVHLFKRTVSITVDRQAAFSSVQSEGGLCLPEAQPSQMNFSKVLMLQLAHCMVRFSPRHILSTVPDPVLVGVVELLYLRKMI